MHKMMELADVQREESAPARVKTTRADRAAPAQAAASLVSASSPKRLPRMRTAQGAANDGALR